MDEHYDYVIVGAGIAGLSAAYYLSADGYRVLVLEATDGTQSASYASTAEMNHDPDAAWEHVMEVFRTEGAKDIWEVSERGIELLSEFSHQLGEPHWNAQRVPAHFFSYTTEGVALLEKKFEQYQKIGANVTLDVAPQLHPSILAVLTTHGDGVTNNQQILKGLAHGVREHGGKILYNTRVTGLDQNRVRAVMPKSMQAVENSAPASGESVEYSGEHIIIATGDGGGLLPDLKIKRKRTFVVSYKTPEQLPELFRDSVLWDTDAPYHYIRSFAGNRLWVGGEDVFEHEYEPTPEHDAEKYARIDTYAREVLGIDSTYTHQATWSGLFYPTARSVPYIGAIPGTPYIASTGFGGTGIVTSFLSGYLLAAWKRGELLEYQKYFALDWE